MSTLKKVIVHLPTVGEPYLVKDKTEKDLFELVAYPSPEHGNIESVSNSSYAIHPLFCENKYWKLADKLRKAKSTTYVNEDGIRKDLNSNMACVILPTHFYPNPQPLVGEVYIQMTKKQYDKVCSNKGYKLKEFNFNEFHADE